MSSFAKGKLVCFVIFLTLQLCLRRSLLFFFLLSFPAARSSTGGGRCSSPIGSRVAMCKGFLKVLFVISQRGLGRFGCARFAYLGGCVALSCGTGAW